MTEDSAGQLLNLSPPRLAVADVAQAQRGQTGILTPHPSGQDRTGRLQPPKLANPAKPASLTRYPTRARCHIAAAAPNLPAPCGVPALDGRSVVLPDLIAGWPVATLSPISLGRAARYLQNAAHTLCNAPISPAGFAPLTAIRRPDRLADATAIACESPLP